ncbi:MAG TPA: TA system VapC family ribonuclease toxin [Candidatus Dormibacteraeota bacterium]|nr:TA system VapC family ribonuclease toxin [Candidatus Dormibacteraeota bacterium]
MTHLLDSNVVAALAVVDHVHHSAAARWWRATEEPFATCPITQGALIRLLIREGLDASAAKRALGLLTGHERHTFWPDDIGYDLIDLSRVLGHAQVTDSYLAALARQRQAKLATFDRGLAKDAPDVVTLIPVT